MKLIAECIVTEIKNIVCREEEGKTICFTHPEYEIVCDIVAIEKCVFSQADIGRRCDYLFLVDKNKQQYNFLKNKISSAFYVELKGIGLVDACEQLLNSIEKTSNQIGTFEIYALVISPKEFNPKYDNNEYYRAVKRLIKKDIQFKISPHTVSF